MDDVKKKLENLPAIRYRLVLTGFEKDLDAEFRDNLISDSLKMVRFDIAITLLLYVIFGVIDLFINLSGKHLSWILCPIVLSIFILTYTKFFRKFFYLTMIFYVLTVAVGIFLGMIVSRNISSLFFSGLIIVIIMLYAGLRIRFIYASVIGITIIIAYEILSVLLNRAYSISNWSEIFISNSFLLIFVDSLGMIASFFLEFYMRHVFLLRKRIQYEEELKKSKTEQELSRIKEERDLIKKIDTLKNDFIANVSHEIRTPLTLIIGPLEAILSGQYGEALRCDDAKVKTMYFNGVKLLKLINNFLDFSKIDAGKMKVAKKNIVLPKLLGFYVETIRSNMENLGLEISFINNTAAGFTVATDVDILEKAVFNLISNSLKFTPPGGLITVQLDDRKDFYDISVKDTGIGIPEDKLNEIFERFHQLDNQPSKKYEGTGIGLALTKELIESLGGAIAVRSKVNEGSTFTITLPSEAVEENGPEIQENDFAINPYVVPDFEKKEESIEADDNKNDQRGKIILVVEDNRDMQKYITSILDEKYIVKTAKNGKEGLEKAHAVKPDLILADVMMPEMDGYQMTELIKSSEGLKGIPVILLTAKAEIFMKIKGFKKGADDYIVKPFNTGELLGRINAHLKIKKLRDEVVKQKDDIAGMLHEKIIAHRLLEESERRFREMAENLPVAIIEANLKNRINYANKYSRDFLGASINDDLLDYFDGTDKDKLKNSGKKLRQKGDLEIDQYALRKKSGARLKALVKLSLLCGKDKIDGIRATIFELEPDCNMALAPDQVFYKTYDISKREKEVIMLLIKGFSYKEIADKLFISFKTAEKHVCNIYEKTKVNGRFSLINRIQEK